WISHKTICQSEREHVHWSRRRDADMPVPDASRIVLHGCLRTGFQNFHRVWLVIHPLQKTCGKAAVNELRLRSDGPQIIQIGLEAIESRELESLAQARDCRISRFRTNDNLREHGIVERRDFRSGFHPGFASRVGWETDFRQSSGARAKVMRR